MTGCTKDDEQQTPTGNDVRYYVRYEVSASASSLYTFSMYVNVNTEKGSQSFRKTLWCFNTWRFFVVNWENPNFNCSRRKTCGLSWNWTREPGRFGKCNGVQNHMKEEFGEFIQPYGNCVFARLQTRSQTRRAFGKGHVDVLIHGNIHDDYSGCRGTTALQRYEPRWERNTYVHTNSWPLLRQIWRWSGEEGCGGITVC